MEIPKFYKKVSFWIAVAIIVLLLVSAYYAYAFMTKSPQTQTSPQNAANNSDLNNKIYDELSKPRDYGAPISTDEAGYGRTNPFAPYK